MLTTAGAIAWIMFAVQQLFSGTGSAPSVLWGLPFLGSFFLADVALAASARGMEALTKSGEQAIINARYRLYEKTGVKW